MSIRTQYRRRAAAGQTQPVFRYPWNDRFFDQWSDEMAWLLGLIWSDGCLMRDSHGVEVCSKDPDLIEIVEGLIEQPGGMRPKNRGRHWRINFSSQHAADRLRGMGLVPAKSHIIGWPQGLPREFEGAFMRGLIDGDGSVLLHESRSGQRVPDLEVSLYSASPTLTEAAMEWTRRAGLNSHVRQNGAVLKITIREQRSLRQLHPLLYPNTDVCCLVRKRVAYEFWLATPRVRAGRPAR